MEMLTQPGTVFEWAYALLVVVATAIVLLGGGGGLVKWLATLVERAEANTDLIKAQVTKLQGQVEAWATGVAPAGSPQQVYAHGKALEFTKVDLVKLIEEVTKIDLPDDVAARAKAIEAQVDGFVLDITDGVNEEKGG